MTTISGPLAAALVRVLDDRLQVLVLAAAAGHVTRHELAVADVEAEAIRRQARAWLDTHTGHRVETAADIPEPWMSSDSLARQLGISQRHARRLVAASPSGRRVGGRWQIHRSDVDEFRRTAWPTRSSP